MYVIFYFKQEPRFGCKIHKVENLNYVPSRKLKVNESLFYPIIYLKSLIIGEAN